MPLVSVITCTYNRKAIINQAIDSILSQNCNFHFEIIIGDDFSTDGTRDLLMRYREQFPDKIRLVFQQENGGIGKNWASAVKAAKGEYLAFCDDDDHWHNPNKLQMQVDYLEAHSACGAVHTEIDIFNEKDGKIVKDSYKTNNYIIPEGKIMMEIFQGKAKICMSSFVVRKDIIDKYVPLDDYIALKFPLQDWPTWLIVAKYADINYLASSTTTYRVGNAGITKMHNLIKAEERFNKELIMYKYICNLFPQDLIYVEEHYKTYSEKMLLNLAYEIQDFKSANKYSKTLAIKGIRNFKILSGQYFVLFYLFVAIKKMKNVFTN